MFHISVRQCRSHKVKSAPLIKLLEVDLQFSAKNRSHVPRDGVNKAIKTNLRQHEFHYLCLNLIRSDSFLDDVMQ